MRVSFTIFDSNFLSLGFCYRKITWHPLTQILMSGSRHGYDINHSFLSPPQVSWTKICVEQVKQVYRFFAIVTMANKTAICVRYLALK